MPINFSCFHQLLHVKSRCEGCILDSLFLLFIASPRSSSSISPGDDECHSEFPGKHFQGDLLLLALGSCQKDLFENDWLDVMVRVYWLKARFLALQVNVYLKFTSG